VKRCALLFVAVLALGCATKQVLVVAGQPNGCSDPLRVFTEYVACCNAHDRAYGLGGTEADRLQADQALYLCVAEMNENDAETMFYAVRLGGRSRFTYRRES
jgi:hypothetical protein